MLTDRSILRPRAAVTAAAAILCPALVAPAAMAQVRSAPAGVGQQYRSGPSEEVIVNQPRLGRSTIGAPIQQVTLSELVRYDDLNLGSVPGIVALRHRVRDTASRLCHRLAFENPIGTPDAWRCRQEAIADATPRVDAVIHNYRGTAFLQQP